MCKITCPHCHIWWVEFSLVCYFGHFEGEIVCESCLSKGKTIYNVPELDNKDSITILPLVTNK